jgi:hypothetical protein
MSWKVLSILFFILMALPVRAQDYAIEELSGEETSAQKPFSITGISPVDGGLRIFINTDDPAAVADLLAEGSLQAQLSDHEAKTENLLPLSLGKAVRCTSESDPVYLVYADPNPDCGGQQPTSIDYFFSVVASLGINRDLAIGEDPDYLWLIEER